MKKQLKLNVIRGHSFDGCNWNAKPRLAWDVIPESNFTSGETVSRSCKVEISPGETPPKDTRGKHITTVESGGLRFLPPGNYGCITSEEIVVVEFPEPFSEYSEHFLGECAKYGRLIG